MPSLHRLRSLHPNIPGTRRTSSDHTPKIPALTLPRLGADPLTTDPKQSSAIDETGTSTDNPEILAPPPGEKNRRLSKEWDASKVPPSRFQKREGSIYATPGSRDGHTKGKERDEKYFEALKEKEEKKGWFHHSKSDGMPST